MILYTADKDAVSRVDAKHRVVMVLGILCISSALLWMPL